MGAHLVFHRVRMAPGKAVALLVIGGKTVFCLPGGPASNEIAFLQIALPGLLRLCGKPPIPFARVPAILTDCVGGDKDWTQFIHAALEWEDGRQLARPLKGHSRLQSQADAGALIQVPEGIEQLDRGTPVYVQVLHHHESGRVPNGEREAEDGFATVSADRHDG
jgi:molybdopterin molybdotransferase